MTVLDLLGVAWLLLVMLLVAAIASATRARRPRGRHVRDVRHRVVEGVERGHLEPVVDHESGDVTYRITEAGRAHLDARLGYDT